MINAKVILIFLAVLAGAILAGCTGTKVPEKDPVILDYAQMPENFVKKIEMNTPYTIKRNGEDFPFLITLHAGASSSYGAVDLQWREWKREEISILRASSRIPYLIYHEGRDYLYLVQENEKTPEYASLAFFDLNNEYFNLDHRQQGLAEEPSDPSRMAFAVSALTLGRGYTIEYYFPGERGAPTPVEKEDPYYYYADIFREDILTLSKDIETEVFASPEATESVLLTLPKGTRFRKFRTDNDTLVDLWMEDGRVARFTVLRMFSEPDPLIMVNGENEDQVFDELR